MRLTKEQNLKQNKGITLIALVITIIVMLILVGVTISIAVNGGLFEYAKSAGTRTNEAIDIEQMLANGAVEIGGVWYDSIDDYINNKPSFNAKYWDKKAAPEDAFIWKSDDPNSEDYGVIVGYTSRVDNWTSLRIPSRCTKIEIDSSYIDNAVDDEARRQMRSYTQNIKEVEIPETVTVIGKQSFGNYSFANLKKVNIPRGVTEIGDCAFADCVNLENVIIPEKVRSIGVAAFFDCKNLKTVTIPKTVISIGDDAFYNVKQIVYKGTATGSPWGALAVKRPKWELAEEWDKKAAPEDVFLWQSDDPNDEGYGVVVGYKVNMDNYPTLRFPSRCEKIIIPYVSSNNDLTEDEIRGFTKNIKEIELPNTVVEIGYGAFSDYDFNSLKKINIPESVEIIGDSAFAMCIGLTSIAIPGSVTSIGEWAFCDCTGLTNIIILNGVKTIEYAAFFHCTGLTSVTIPDSVTYIGNNAFYNVKEISYNGLAYGSPWGALSFIGGEEAEEWDKTATPEDVFLWQSNYKDDDGYRVIVGYTARANNYTTLRIPRRCREIKTDHSYNTDDLTQIRSYTQNIKEIELPNTVERIGYGAFYNSDPFSPRILF